MTIDISFDEIQWDERGFNDLLRSPQGPLGEQMDIWGLQIASTATYLTTGVMVNVQSGRLSGSMTHQVFTDPRTGELALTVGSDVEYAGYVHEGTENEDGSVRMAGRPYLDRALEIVIESLSTDVR